MNASPAPNRIEYIDVAKGIGILLVVLAHSDLALISPYMHQFIYSFHVPLFFFLSGYFFKPNVSLRVFAWKRFNAILKPYLFTILLIYIASISFTNMSIGTALGRFAKSMYATTTYIEWIPLWFLPSLFITSLLAFFFYRYLFVRVNHRIVRWLILLVTLVAGVIFIEAFYPFSVSFLGRRYELYGLPYSLDIVLVSGFFYMLGSEVRELHLDGIFNRKLFSFSVALGLIILNAIFSQRMDLAVRVYPSLVINTTAAVLGIMFVLALSKLIDMNTTWLANALSYIGRASLFVLIFHVVIQEFWGAKIYFLTGWQGFSILAAFVISTGLSLGIYKIFVEHNPIALFLFGRRATLSDKPDRVEKANPKE